MRPSVKNECQSDADCAEGFCDESLLICARSEAPLAPTVIEVLSQSSGGQAAFVYAFEGRQYTDSNAGSFVLPPFVTLAGTVRSGRDRVPSRITLRRTSRISREAFFAETNTVNEPESIPGAAEPVDFAFTAPPADDYELLIEPTGEWASELPPLLFPGQALLPSDEMGSSGALQLVEVVYSREAITEIEGRLVQGEELEAVEGLQVDIVEQGTGRVVSTTSISGADGREDGAFRLAYDSSVDRPTDLRIRATEGRSFPTLLIATDSLTQDEMGGFTITLPEFEEVSFDIAIAPSEESGAQSTGGEGLGGSLVFRSLSLRDEEGVVDGGGAIAAFHQTQVALDERRESVSLELFEGEYEVFASPGTSSALNVALTTIDSEDDDASLTLEPQSVVAGRIVTYDGRAGFGVPISMLARGADTQATVSEVMARNRSAEAFSEEDGSFAVSVDRGSYDVQMRPSPVSGFPWIIREDVVVDAPRLDFAETVVLSIPWVLRGELARANGESISGAEVRAFRESASAEGRLVEVASSLSDEAGAFSLLLP